MISACAMLQIRLGFEYFNRVFPSRVCGRSWFPLSKQVGLEPALSASHCLYFSTGLYTILLDTPGNLAFDIDNFSCTCGFKAFCKTSSTWDLFVASHPTFSTARASSGCPLTFSGCHWEYRENQKPPRYNCSPGGIYLWLGGILPKVRGWADWSW